MENSTSIERIKNYLESGGKLTVLKALQLFKTTEMRSVASKLKKRGLNITSKRVADGRHFEYWLAS